MTLSSLNLNKSNLAKSFVRKCCATIILIAVWQALSVALPIQYRGLVIAGPLVSLRALCTMAVTSHFWQCLFSSSIRFIAGLVFACAGAIVTAATCLRFPVSEVFIAPFVALMKNLPIVVIVVLLLIMFSSTGITLAVVFLATFPILYTAFLTGFRASNIKDIKLLEMARVFNWTGFQGLIKRWRWIRLPAAKSYLKSALLVSAGMSWKAGIAAEIIGVPANSIGWALYSAKITLSTEEIFAWAAVILLLGFFTEQLALTILRLVLYMTSSRVWFHSWQELEHGQREHKNHELFRATQDAQDIKICHLSKCFSRGINNNCDENSDSVIVFQDLNLTFSVGKITALMGESGSGKTTLLHMLLGLLPFDAGLIQGVDLKRCSALFQENRLIEHLSAIDNIFIAFASSKKSAISRADIIANLHAVGLTENLNAPVRELSGGMARRVALVRALIVPSDIVFLDEPLSGLDAENVRRAIQYIKAEQRGRTIVAIVHEREHAAALCDHDPSGHIVEIVRGM